MKIRVNTDKELVAEIRKGLANNDGYCPCRTERLPEYKCMCKEFIDQKTPGECHCGLYVKVNE